MARMMGFTDVVTGEKFAVDMWKDPLYESETWTDAGGRVWPIEEMHTRHIVFTIRLVRRRARALAKRAAAAMESWAFSPLGARGDMAMDAQEAALDEVWLATVFAAQARERVEESPLVRALKAELILRDEPWSAP